MAEQIPSTNLFTTIATDNNPWAINAQQLSATNTFTVCLKAPAAGPPFIQAINVVSGIVTISWSSVLGHTYRLQFKDALMDPNWSNQPPDIHAVNDSSSATNDPGTTPLRLYRVQLVD